MSGEPVPIPIPRPLLEEVYLEALESFPSECCGWLYGPRHRRKLTGIVSCPNRQLEGHHPVANERGPESAFVIGGSDLLRLNRDLDGPYPPKVIYHSHPNGRAYLSRLDQEVATNLWGDGPVYPLQQLVVGLAQSRVREAALFAWSTKAVAFVEVATFPGSRG